MFYIKKDNKFLHAIVTKESQAGINIDPIWVCCQKDAMRYLFLEDAVDPAYRFEARIVSCVRRVEPKFR